MALKDKINGQKGGILIRCKLGREHFVKLGQRRAGLAGSLEMSRIGKLGGEEYVRRYITAGTGLARRHDYSDLDYR